MVVPSPPPSNAAAKALLRTTARTRRKAFFTSLSADERWALERRLLPLFMPCIKRARVLAVYHPHGSEIDPAQLLFWAGNHHVTVAHPAFLTATSTMIFRGGRCAEDCPVGGVQPPAQAAEVEPDLVLVPLLAVDSVGNRLGQGGGHYDRALPALQAKNVPIIGLGWAMQQVDFLLPTDPWDVPLDAFLSPAGLMEFQ